MTEVIKLAPDEANQNPSTQTVSLLDALAETTEDAGSGDLERLRIGPDACFFSLFTDQVVPVSVHFLEATETWSRSYVHCTGDDCPVCRAGISPTQYLLLPVADRLDGCIKVLWVNRQRGPGKLLTELGQVLALPNREDLVIRVTRNANFVHDVTFEAETSLDPALGDAVRTFAEKMENGTVDVTSVIPYFPPEELITHERIAKRLTLVRGA